MTSVSAVLLYTGLQCLVHTGAQDTKGRQWGLSAINAALMSVYGVAYWMFDRGVETTAFTDRVLYQLQTYLIVDLVYNGFINREARQSLLEFWVHHTAYVLVLELIIANGMSGLGLPYIILEIPAAIRSWGTIQPAWRTDAGFGLTFFALRVVLPFYIAARDYQLYHFICFVTFVGMQAMHIYWFSLWCKSQLPRMIEAAWGVSAS
jgi:hypothetical protein